MESNLMKEKINLLDCTFIIPLKVDSEDREKNFLFVSKFLFNNFDTNIIITESSPDNSFILGKKYKNIIDEYNIKLIEIPNQQKFYRTRYLNDMLLMSKTKITVNYDIDVLLPKNSYIQSANLILNEGYDLIYPYGNGMYQYMVPQNYRDEVIANKFKTIDLKKCQIYTSVCGHAQFFNTESYKRGYGENENFISYGPEDKERFFRFKALNFKVKHLDNNPVLHLEHYRGKDSGGHEDYENNDKLWQQLQKYSPNQLIDYYNNQEYVKQKFL